MRWSILLAFLAIQVSACAPKVMILQAPIVSMSKINTGDQTQLGEGKEIEEKWCSDDEPAKANDDGSKHYGMIDQVVWKAHRATKADFFMNCRFYQQGTCVFMSANVAKGSGGGEGAEKAEPAPSKVKKAKKRKKAE